MARKDKLSKRAAKTAAAADVREPESHRVFTWRLKVLEDAGAPREVAKRVADSDFDLHKAADMLAAGCSPETLLKIVL